MTIVTNAKQETPRLTLYSYFRSSASYRVRIALNLKGLPYTYKAVHLLEGGGQQNLTEYRQLNPSAQVPTLVHHGATADFALGQSVAIIDYLDHITPSPRLFPLNPVQRALVLQACEIINSGSQPLHNLGLLQALERDFGATQEQRDKWSAHWIDRGLKAYDQFVAQHGQGASVGDDITAAECFLIPHLANAVRFKVDLSPYPRLTRIGDFCRAREAFMAAAPERQPDWPS